MIHPQWQSERVNTSNVFCSSLVSLIFLILCRENLNKENFEKEQIPCSPGRLKTSFQPVMRDNYSCISLQDKVTKNIATKARLHSSVLPPLANMLITLAVHPFLHVWKAVIG